MAGQDSNDQNVAAVSPACTLSLNEHIETTLAALTIFGVGIGCETQYQALLVLAEVAKQLHGHADFDPVEKARQLVVEAKEAHRRLMDRQQQAILENMDDATRH